MDPNMVAAVQDRSVPKYTLDVRSFIRFANVYRRFIPNISGVVRPLTALTGKGAKGKWPKECQWGFEKRREVFLTAPVLSHSD